MVNMIELGLRKRRQWSWETVALAVTLTGFQNTL